MHYKERKKCVGLPHIHLFLFPFAMKVIEKDSKNRWMGFTHHNRNLRFKQPGERSGFPGKTYRPLSTTFGGRLSSRATCWAVPWLHVFVCSMGGPSRNQTHNHSPALQIKKCTYTLLSREAATNQFRNIRRVEYTEGTDRGSPGLCKSGYSYTCRIDFAHRFKSGWVYWQDWTILSQSRWAWAHVEVVRIKLIFKSFIQYTRLAWLQLHQCKEIKRKSMKQWTEGQMKLLHHAYSLQNN